MKTYTMLTRGGNPAANQTIFKYDDREVFRSYHTNVVMITPNGDFLDPMWDCSRTTIRYVRQYLDKTLDEIRKGIKSGEFKIIDLNTGEV